jgi:hypothetical protein
MVDFTGLARLPLFLAAETWPIGITKAMETTCEWHLDWPKEEHMNIGFIG